MIAAREKPVSGTSWLGVILCALVGFVDGYDTQILSPTAGTIARSLGFAPASLGFVFSASQIGFLLGTLLVGPLGDRFGRKRVLLLCIGLFALCALGTSMANSYDMLFAARLISGFGLGGATPNFVSLASEYAPPAQRARVVTMTWAAVPLGGMASAIASNLYLATLGWRALFLIGCVVPLLLLAALSVALPASSETGRKVGASLPVTEALFAEGRGASTAWLWLASFVAWMALIVVVFWTPTLSERAGIATSGAAGLLAAHNVGGIVGTLLVGALIGLLRPTTALLMSLVGSVVATIAIALFLPAWTPVAAAMLFAGFFGSAAGATLLAVSTEIYPPVARATGVGFALAAGRLGTIIGPTAIGMLVNAQWPVGQIYFAIAAAPALAALFVLMLRRARSTSQAQGN